MAGYRNGNYDIYMYNISTLKETQITTNKSDQINPAIYGNLVVWLDFCNGESDIYMYDLSNSKKTQITTDELPQECPAIYRDRISLDRCCVMDTTVFSLKLHV